MTRESTARPATFTVDETAAILRINRATAYAGVAEGAIPSLRIGRRILIPSAQLLALLGEDIGPEDRPI